ncbi:hypothetical protein B9Z19DRAFT_1135149 [Tuber borchii]|uniref:Uncharacterized protein n=1 Tax=Tuber borchii TaxID=42251 RepID=A0A2T6ZDF7_TUBBO|nr:hypothetical protein B9Z19DRAFT_1135149 [Tuber borchii]
MSERVRREETQKGQGKRVYWGGVGTARGGGKTPGRQWSETQLSDATGVKTHDAAPARQTHVKFLLMLVTEVYQYCPYAAPYGKIMAAWGEILFNLQAKGFYKNIKSALPTLRKDIHDLIAYKEGLGNEEQIAEHLGEVGSREQVESSGIINEQGNCKQFPFSREMFNYGLASHLERIADDMTAIASEKEIRSKEKRKGEDDKQRWGELIREAACTGLVRSDELNTSTKRKTQRHEATYHTPKKIHRTASGGVRTEDSLLSES